MFASIFQLLKIKTCWPNLASSVVRAPHLFLPLSRISLLPFYLSFTYHKFHFFSDTKLLNSQWFYHPFHTWHWYWGSCTVLPCLFARLWVVNPVNTSTLWGMFQCQISPVVWKLVVVHPSILCDCLKPLNPLLVTIQRVTLFLLFFLS